MFRPGIMKISQTRALPIYHLLLLAVIPFIAYAPSLSGDFVYDDIAITVVENPALSGEVSWLEILSWDRPLREFTYMLDHAIWDYNPLGYHLQNMGWHIANTILLYFFLLFLGFDRTPSFLAALLFSIHPISTESVAWISGRKELLCLFFELASCYLLTYFIFHQRERAGLSRWGVYTASLFACVLALLSKQVAVVLPFLMALSCWFYARTHAIEFPTARLFKALILPSLLTVAFLLHGYDLVSRLSGALDRGTYFDPSSRDVSYTFLSAVLTPFATLIRSLWLLVWPMDLTIEHGFAPVVSIADYRWMLGGATVAILVFFAVRLCRTKPIYVFGLGWIVLAWGPVSGMIPVSYLMANRYLYIPCAGFCVLGMWVGGIVLKRFETIIPKLSLAAVILVCLLFGIRTGVRTLDWQNEISLWEAAARSRPNHEKVYINLGNAYSDRNRMEEAFEHWNHALELKPDLPQVWVNMGRAHNRQNEPDQAESCYRKALELFPAYGIAHFNLALMMDAQRQSDVALKHFRLAAKYLYGKRSTARRQGMAYYHVARILYEKGDFQSSNDHLIHAERLAPNFAPIFLLKGLLHTHDIPQTRRAFEDAIRLDPSYADAFFNLGVLEWQQGNTASALNCWDEAVRLNPKLAPRIENVKKSKK